MLPDQYEKISLRSASGEADRCLFSSSLQGALHVGTVQFTPPMVHDGSVSSHLQIQTCILFAVHDSWHADDALS